MRHRVRQARFNERPLSRLRLRALLVRSAMPFEKGVGDETLAAIRAPIRPLARVVTRVKDQRRPLREASVALRTHVRLLARVRSLVDAEVLLAGEFLVARVAPEDPLARVTALVHRQPPHGRQLRAAQVAQVLGRGVARESMLILHVPPQQPLVHESLRAERARVLRPRVLRGRRSAAGRLLLARVLRRQVYRQILLVEVAPVTVLAAIQVLVGVHVPVLEILGLVEEALVARLAPEGVVLRVPSTMALQIGLLIGAVPAELAGEHLQPGVDQFVAGYVHRAAKRLAALVAAEGAIDVVQVLQVLHELPRVAEAGAALDALMHGARFAPSLPEMKESE